MSVPSLPRLAVLAVSLLALGILATCGGKDGGTAPNVVTGPTFNFTFTMNGTSQERVFTEVGTWNYRCTPHGSSGMQGTVTVDGSSLVDSAVVAVGASNALVFSPAAVTIKTGGKVRWVNVSNLNNHTATR